MRKVIIIEGNDKEEKGIEFTHLINRFSGFIDTDADPKCYDKIVYLGADLIDGDLFAVYIDKSVLIFKGHLNNGTY